MRSRPVVTIDGPSGAGKTTVSKRVPGAREGPGRIRGLRPRPRARGAGGEAAGDGAGRGRRPRREGHRHGRLPRRGGEILPRRRGRRARPSPLPRNLPARLPAVRGGPAGRPPARRAGQHAGEFPPEGSPRRGVHRHDDPDRGRRGGGDAAARAGSPAVTKKVLIAKSAGFCFGVKRAIAIADETAGKRGEGSGDEAPIQSLGPIIHNPQAVERLQEKGVRGVGTVDDIPCGEAVLRAHGGPRAQTTQSFDNLMAFVTAAMKRFPEVRVFNTICNATALRQQESTGLAERADVMFVLGGYNSANTRRLAEICKAINPRTHHIETEEELTPEMVAGASVAGVTAGASTPQWIIAGFLERLKELWKCDQIEVSFYR